MRLSRADLGPLLAIAAGGFIGASLSFGFLGSRSDDVPAAEPVSTTYESVVVLPFERLEEAKANSMDIYTFQSRLAEAQRLLERDRQERLRTDIEKGLNEIEFRLRKELQEPR